MSETPASVSPPGEAPASGRRWRVPGWVWVILIFLALQAVVGLVLMPRILRGFRPNPLAQSVNQAKQIYNACQAFAAIRGRLPATLDELVPDFVPDRHALGDPAHDDAGEPGYLYYGSGAIGTEPPETLFLASKEETDGLRVIVLFDGKTRAQRLAKLPAAGPTASPPPLPALE